MSEEVEIPGLPEAPKAPKEGLLDASLDIDLGDGTSGEIRRARAGLDGDWENGALSLHVNWDDPFTYDDDSSGWDDAILFGDDD